MTVMKARPCVKAPVCARAKAGRAGASRAVGLTLAFAGAPAVLFIASAPHRAAAVKQGAFPLLAGHRLPCRTSGALERNGYWLCASPFELPTKPVFVLD